MHDNDREWRGIWIPKEVWLDERLSALEKIILFEIDSLDKEDGCYASNEYIAQFCQCSAWKVSTAISKLTELGYIRFVSFDGRHRTLKSCIRFTTEQPCEIQKAAFGETHAINTSYKNKIDSNTDKKSSSKSTSSEYPSDFLTFWKAYPNGKSKRDALKAWNSLRPSEELQGVILADVAKKKTSEDWLKENGKYIPYPATYLRGRRWEDEAQDTVQDTVQDNTVGPFGAWRV